MHKSHVFVFKMVFVVFAVEVFNFFFCVVVTCPFASVMLFTFWFGEFQAVLDDGKA